jgi:hypothetical protein
MRALHCITHNIGKEKKYILGCVDTLKNNNQMW